MTTDNEEILYAGASNDTGNAAAVTDTVTNENVAAASGGGMFILSGAGQAGASGSEGNEQPKAFRQLAVFTGTGGELFELWIVNFLLTVITLGIYHFWAKVRVRKYLWAHTVVEGEPLEYTGSGKELFIGFLIVSGLFVLYMIAQVMLDRVRPGLSALATIMLMPIWFFATYRAIRYRLTRTRWRGIRFNLSGSAWSYTLLAVGQALLNVVTLSLWYPKAKAKLTRRIIGNMWFGNSQFSFTGPARPLYAAYLFSTVGLLVFAAVGFFCCRHSISFKTAWERVAAV